MSLNLTQGQLCVTDFGEGSHPKVNFHPLSCHHIQKLPGFSAPLQTTPVDSVQPLGLVSSTFVAFVSLPTQLLPLPEEHYNYILEPLCPIFKMFFE